MAGHIESRLAILTGDAPQRQVCERFEQQPNPCLRRSDGDDGTREEQPESRLH